MSVEGLTGIGVILTFFIGLFNLFYSIKISKKTLYINAVTSERVKWMTSIRDYISEYVSITTLYNQKELLTNQKEINDYLNKVLELDCKIKLYLNYKGERDEEILNIITRITDNTNWIYNEGLYNSNRKDSEKIKDFVYKNLNNIVAESRNHIEYKEDYTEQEIAEIAMKSYKIKIAEYNNEFKNKASEVKEQLLKDSKELITKCQEYLKIEWNRVKSEAEHGNRKNKKTKHL